MAGPGEGVLPTLLWAALVAVLRAQFLFTWVAGVFCHRAGFAQGDRLRELSVSIVLCELASEVTLCQCFLVYHHVPDSVGGDTRQHGHLADTSITEGSLEADTQEERGRDLRDPDTWK